MLLGERIPSVKIRACFVPNLNSVTMELSSIFLTSVHLYPEHLLNFFAKDMKMFYMEAESMSYVRGQRLPESYPSKYYQIGGRCSPKEGAGTSRGQKWEFYMTN